MSEQARVIDFEEVTSAHDLRLLGSEIRLEYFPRCGELSVRWGQQIGRKRRRSIRLGSYDHRSSEVRVHPSLNAPSVPRFFIQSIIYHEYLHHLFGPDHNQRFHAQERRYKFHRESKLWLKANLLVLLGRRTRPSIPATFPRPLPLHSPLQLSLF